MRLLGDALSVLALIAFYGVLIYEYVRAHRQRRKA